MLQFPLGMDELCPTGPADTSEARQFKTTCGAMRFPFYTDKEKLLLKSVFTANDTKKKNTYNLFESYTLL